MISRIVPLALALALSPLAAQARHGLKGDEAAPVNAPSVVPCQATVSGAVKASFACKADLRMAKEGGLRIAFTPGRLPKNVAAFMGGPVEVAGPVKPQTYAAETLRSGRVMLNGPRHAAYGAEAGQPRRGDITVTLDKVSVAEHASSAKGQLVARLVPLDPARKGDVVVTIRF